MREGLRSTTTSKSFTSLGVQTVESYKNTGIRLFWQYLEGSLRCWGWQADFLVGKTKAGNPVMPVTTGRSGYSMLVIAGMNLLSKAVTVLLLVVFGALPMLGAAACKADTKSAMCCIPGCSMVEMEKTGAQAEIGSVGSGSSCCKAVPDMPLSMFTPISSHLLTEVMLVGTTTAHNYPHMTLRVAEANTPSNRSLHGRSQSILCNFRI